MTRTSHRWPGLPHGARARRPLLALTAAIALALVPIGAPVRAQAQADAPQADLPVTRVVATTSGLATFEHAGTVTGTQELTLRVPEDAMDDLLQSLVLEDLDGGTVRPVRYDARDPLGRILASYAFDLRGAPGLAELLAQARGEAVVVDGPSTVRGTLLAVERVPSPDAPDAWYLTVSGDAGLTRLPLAEVRSVRFARAELQAELDAALAALARDLGRDAAELRIRFEGVGERRVRVAYVREMPVWKSSYRLVVRDDGVADLQGWAILDNPTDLDLVDVDVTFLAGAPISFVTELYDPVYVDRPRVGVATTEAFVPDADTGAFEAEAAPSLRAPAPMMGALAQDAAPAAAPRLAGAGVDAMAQGTRTGSAFAYRVDEPVTVGRYASAMVPIVQAEVPAHRVTTYAPGTADGTPLRAIRIANDSDVLLAAGTVTVFDEAGFAGNARLGDLAPGGERLLRFASDLGVRVDAEREATPEEIVAVRIDGGLLRTEVRQRATTRYRVATDDDEARFLVVEHPAQDGWEVASPGPAPARTEDAWRFGVALNGAEDDPDLATHLRCEVGDACALEVVLERVDARTLAVTDLGPDRIAVLLQNVETTASDREALARIAALQRRVAELEAALAEQETRRDDVHREQDRIRENLAVLERNSDLYRRYIADLGAQEDELDVILTAIEGFRTELADARDRLQAAIRDLPTLAD